MISPRIERHVGDDEEEIKRKQTPPLGWKSASSGSTAGVLPTSPSALYLWHYYHM